MTETPAKALSFPEFAALVSCVMAMTALGIDAMLPALPEIGRSLRVDNANHLQWVVAIFFFGHGLGQLIFGILSDWLGRKRMLLIGIGLFAVLMAATALVSTLPALLTLRLLQGVCAASASVVTRAVVRDLYSGAQMARVMSTSYVMFLAVPVLAPSLGQLILLVLPWPAIFLAIAVLAAAVCAWMWLRLPETHPPERRQRPNLRRLISVALFVLTQPVSVVYTLAVACMLSTMLAYVSLMPQIFHDVFAKPQWLAPVFAVCALGMAAGSVLNATLVEKLGVRRMSHTALVVFIIVTFIHMVWAFTGQETLISFVVLQGLTMTAMTLCTANFNALSMEPTGAVAGTAASLQGVFTAVVGSCLGGFVGQHWTGDIALLPLGACLCGALAFACILVGDRKRLFG
ncbi:multidrug effflux MFS transporter [Asticcacaulis biprosthecium]|uniref:multidrug effflux MFS transporter n=1 Tax=Asticcacaulis biprosthecium TaxID=76891 RepID=UPI00058B8079|nr:multidrug effflux MFS transporter [Asticcacaulis biprosthecium]